MGVKESEDEREDPGGLWEALLGLAGGTGTRHRWVCTCGHTSGPCSLPVPSGRQWGRFWGECPGRAICSSAKPGGCLQLERSKRVQFGAGAKEAEGARKVWQRSWAGGDTCYGCGVWGSTPLSRDPGEEGHPRSWATFNRVCWVTFCPSALPSLLAASGQDLWCVCGTTATPHPPFSPRSPAAVTTSSSAGRSRGAP